MPLLINQLSPPFSPLHNCSWLTISSSLIKVQNSENHQRGRSVTTNKKKTRGIFCPQEHRNERRLNPINRKNKKKNRKRDRKENPDIEPIRKPRPEQKEKKKNPRTNTQIKTPIKNSLFQSIPPSYGMQVQKKIPQRKEKSITRTREGSRSSLPFSASSARSTAPASGGVEEETWGRQRPGKIKGRKK